MSGVLSGRGAFITGAASGIGAACARLFATEGAEVVVADLPSSQGLAYSVVADIAAAGGVAHWVECDVTSIQQTRIAFADANDLVGDISVVVTSAGVATMPGVSHHMSLLKMDPEHWNHVLAVNLTGTLTTTQVAAAQMIDRGISGSIVTLSSFAAKRPTRGVYSVSKAAVWMLTRALAEELSPQGIRVNALGPGIIDTPMLGDAADIGVDEWKQSQVGRISMRRIGDPLDVAEAALFLASNQSKYITGAIVPVDGGLTSTFAGG